MGKFLDYLKKYGLLFSSEELESLPDIINDSQEISTNVDDSFTYPVSSPNELSERDFYVYSGMTYSSPIYRSSTGINDIPEIEEDVIRKSDLPAKLLKRK